MEKLLQWQFYSELWEEVVILSYWCNLYGDLWVNLEGLRMKKKESAIGVSGLLS